MTVEYWRWKGQRFTSQFKIASTAPVYINIWLVTRQAERMLHAGVVHTGNLNDTSMMTSFSESVLLLKVFIKGILHKYNPNAFYTNDMFFYFFHLKEWSYKIPRKSCFFWKLEPEASFLHVGLINKTQIPVDLSVRSGPLETLQRLYYWKLQ